jgi:hypothetical protein
VRARDDEFWCQVNPRAPGPLEAGLRPQNSKNSVEEQKKLQQKKLTIFPNQRAKHFFREENF